MGTSTRLIHQPLHARTNGRRVGCEGIQALDLLGRKILLQGGKNWRRYSMECFKYMKTQVRKRAAAAVVGAPRFPTRALMHARFPPAAD